MQLLIEEIGTANIEWLSAFCSQEFEYGVASDPGKPPAEGTIDAVRVPLVQRTAHRQKYLLNQIPRVGIHESSANQHPQQKRFVRTHKFLPRSLINGIFHPGNQRQVGFRQCHENSAMEQQRAPENTLVLFGIFPDPARISQSFTEK
jgi:hypothetical protein